MAASLPVPVRLLHLNELDDELGRASRRPRARRRSWGATVAAWRELVGAAELDAMAGSVAALEVALRRHLEEPRGAA